MLAKDTRLRVHAKAGTLKWCMDNFLLDARARDLTDDTIEWYTRKLRPFTAYLVLNNVQQISRMSIRDVQGYIVALRDGGMSPANINSHARAMRAFLHWLVDNDLAEVVLTRAFKMPRQPKVIREGFTTEQVQRLIEAAKETPTPERDTAVLLLMADTGLRAGEIGRIRDCDCELDRVLIHGKGRKERFVPLAPHTRKAIQRWRKKRGPSDWLFLTARDEPFTRQTVYKLFRRLGEVLGFSLCHPHMMRRTTAVQWIKAGGDTFTLQTLLGHSSQTMSKVYVELADDDVAAAHRRLSLVERLGKRR